MKDFILASASPRRSALLSGAGFRFDIIPSQVDEDAYSLEGIGAGELTRILAKAKAFDVAMRHKDRLVVGADCVVSVDNHIIGKPKDVCDAERIIRLLFAKPHQVITSVAFIAINDGIEITETETTTVYPKKLTDRQIADYLATGQWEGKAGAYGIQDPQTDDFIDRIEGSYTNVMGMPMEKTVEVLVGRLIIDN